MSHETLADFIVSFNCNRVFWYKGECCSSSIIGSNSDLRGGGGGVHPDYFVKLDFEIAVDQQTRARYRTFEGVPDSG